MNIWIYKDKNKDIYVCIYMPVIYIYMTVIWIYMYASL